MRAFLFSTRNRREINRHLPATQEKGNRKKCSFQSLVF